MLGGGRALGISVPNSIIKGRELSRGGKITPGGMGATKAAAREGKYAKNFTFGTRSVVTGKGAKKGLKEGAGIGQKGGVVKTKDLARAKTAEKTVSKWGTREWGKGGAQPYKGKGYSGTSPTMSYGRAMRLAKAKKAARETKRGKNK